MMKRILMVLTFVCLAIVLISCGKEENYSRYNLFNDNIMILTKEENGKSNIYYYNKSGKKIAGPYATANRFHKGYALVSDNDGSYLINTKGKRTGFKIPKYSGWIGTLSRRVKSQGATTS